MPSLLKRLTAAVRGRGPTMPRTRPFVEMGVAGTAVYGGYITTREKSSKWTGQQRWVTAADMAVNTPIIAAGMWHVTRLIAHPSWSFTPADDSPQARELAEFAEEVLLGGMVTPWTRVVRRASMYLYHGFGIQEWTAVRRSDGRVGIRDVEPRPGHTIERWDVADDGAVRGVVQRSPQTGAALPIPRTKIMYLVEDTFSDSPEGLGLLRMLVSSWERLAALHKLETTAFERDLRGIPIGRIPYTMINSLEGYTDEQKKELVRGMEDMVKLVAKQTDTGLTMDSMPYESEASDGRKVSGEKMWDLELLQGSSTGVEALDKAIHRTQLEMARVLMAEHLMMGESAGNRSLGEDKSRNLYLVTNAVLSDIAAAVDRDLLDPLWTLNNFPDELRPRASPEDVAFKDAETVARVLKEMATAGATLSPSDPVVADVRELMGVSPPEQISPELAGLGGGAASSDERSGEDIDEAVEEEAAQKRARPALGKGAPRSLYVRRPLLNGFEVRAWARQQGLPSTLAPDDMHVTVAFSKEPVDWSLLQPLGDDLGVAGDERAVYQFPPRNTPNGALVLRFESPELAARWQEFLDAGASWDFPEYLPHVTLTYSVPEADVSGIRPYTGPLVFGPEQFAEVSEDWAGDITEQPLRGRARRVRSRRGV